jgi:hypothetical protein
MPQRNKQRQHNSTAHVSTGTGQQLQSFLCMI